MSNKKAHTSFDIALLAGVSQSTVSRALSGSRSVAEPTRQRILDIARQLDYQVDLRARHLRTHETGALTLLMFADDEQARLNPFFLSMIGGITRAAKQRGYDLLVSLQQLSNDWHADYEKSRKSDGLILLGYGDFDELNFRLASLVEQGTHFVRWGCIRPNQYGLSVGCDNVQGSRTATEHLLGLGRTKLVFIGDSSPASPEFHDRFFGFHAALRNAGRPESDVRQIDATLNDEQAGYLAIKRLLSSGLDFDGIVAASDQIALSAIRALEESGIRVPRDVAIVGFDDIPLTALMNPPLTTVRQDTQAAGVALVDHLLKIIAGQTVHNLALGTELIVRKSCGAELQCSACATG